MSDYLRYWNLKQSPFSAKSSKPNGFISASNQNLLKQLTQQCQHSSDVTAVLYNDELEKKIFLKDLYHSFSAENEVLLYSIIHPVTSENWLLPRIARFFDTKFVEPTTPVDYFKNISNYLDDLQAESRHLIMLIDDADKISGAQAFIDIDIIQKLNKLSEINSTFIFFTNATQKTPLLDKYLDSKHQLKKFELSDAVAYLNYCVKNYDLSHKTFSAEMINTIYKASESNMSTFATICESCLLEAYIKKVKVISRQHVLEVGPQILGISKSQLITKIDAHSSDKSTPELLKESLIEAENNSITSSITLAELIEEKSAS